jgi:hypothetical protein
VGLNVTLFRPRVNWTEALGIVRKGPKTIVTAKGERLIWLDRGTASGLGHRSGFERSWSVVEALASDVGPPDFYVSFGFRSSQPKISKFANKTTYSTTD